MRLENDERIYSQQKLGNGAAPILRRNPILDSSHLVGSTIITSRPLPPTLPCRELGRAAAFAGCDSTVGPRWLLPASETLQTKHDLTGTTQKRVICVTWAFAGEMRLCSSESNRSGAIFLPSVLPKVDSVRHSLEHAVSILDTLGARLALLASTSLSHNRST